MVCVSGRPPGLKPREAAGQLHEFGAVTNPLKAGWRVVAHVGHEYSSYGVPRLAAAMAYYAAASMAPMLVVVVAIVGFALGSESARQHLTDQVNVNVGPQGVKLLNGLLDNITAAHRGLIATLISLGAILLGSTAFFSEVQDALNAIWRVRTNRSAMQNMLVSRLKAFGMVVGIGFLLTISVMVGFVVDAAAQQVAHWVPASQTVLHVANSLLTLVLVTVLFALIFRFVPDERLPWKSIVAGAIITGVLFVAGKLGISYYIAKASVGSAYGAAGSLVAVLVWIYYSAQVFLIGAILTHAFAMLNRVGAAIDERRAA